MRDRLIILGCGTCQLEPERMASSVLVESGKDRFLFDIGRGISLRLVQCGLKQDDLEHIVLSHFHPDHVGDLIPYLQAACWSRTDARSKKLKIYGPLGTRVQVMRLIAAFGPDELLKDSFEVETHEIRGDSFQIGNIKISVSDLPPAGNRGVKFIINGKTVALTGDSSFHQEEINFLSGSDISVIDSGHLTDEEIVALAVKSKCKKIYLSHLYRALDLTVLQGAAKTRGFSGQFIIAEDMMEIEL